MVGLPASGKSSLTVQYESLGYTVLSLDRGTMINSTDISTLNRVMSDRKKVVIDNTNVLIDVRKKFIEYARNNSYSIGAHHVNTSKENCLINSLNRMYDRCGKVYTHKSQIDVEHKNDPNLFVLSAIFSMSKNFQKIKPEEGFDQIEITKFERTDRYHYDNKAVFVDLDGTVRKSRGSQPYPITETDIEMLPNSEAVLKRYKDAGYKIIAVTNQSGIGKKIVSAEKVKSLIDLTNQLMDNVIDDYSFCPHLPPSDMCYCRKPQSGTGILMMHKHKLNLAECIMVGDATSDNTFAERLGMKHYFPNEFFDRSEL